MGITHPLPDLGPAAKQPLRGREGPHILGAQRPTSKWMRVGLGRLGSAGCSEGTGQLGGSPFSPGVMGSAAPWGGPQPGRLSRGWWSAGRGLLLVGQNPISPA